MSACDYSSARPGGAALRAAGITAVGRYLAGDPNYAGALGPAEFADLRAHGIDVWVNYEGTNAGMLGGYAQGVADGRKAAQNLARLGLTVGNVVVYASADFDPNSSQYAALDAYLDGFGSVLGPPAVIGIYGSLPYINHCRATGKATWFWQSASSSFTHGATGFVHIQQTTLPSLPDTDNDILHAGYYGQIGATLADLGSQPFDPTTPKTTPPEGDDEMQVFIASSDGKQGLIKAGISYIQDASGPLRPLSTDEYGSYVWWRDKAVAAGLQAVNFRWTNWPGDQIEGQVNRYGLLEMTGPAGAAIVNGQRLTGRVIYAANDIRTPGTQVDIAALSAAIVAALPTNTVPPTPDVIAAAVRAEFNTNPLTGSLK